MKCRRAAALNESILTATREMLRTGWPDGLERYWPLQYEALGEPDVLFIGMNPSGRGALRIEDELLPQSAAPNPLVLPGPPLPHPYYCPLPALACGHSWHHLDLFPLMHASQAQFKTALKLGRPLEEWAPCTRDLFEQTIQAILDSAARVVVGVNAFASDLVLARLRRTAQAEWDDGKGWYWVTQGSPVRQVLLPSGMVSGRNRVDKYSAERLKWQIAIALKATSQVGRDE